MDDPTLSEALTIMTRGFVGLNFFNKHRSVVHECVPCMTATAHAVVNGLDLQKDQEKFHDLMCPAMRTAADDIINAERLVRSLRAQQSEEE